LFKAAAGGDAEKLQGLLGSGDFDLNQRFEKENNKTLLHVVRFCTPH
jgi:hypothetical protein